MIDRGKLLSDLQSLLRKLETDLLVRSDLDDVLEVGQTLRHEHQKAQEANRTAQSYEEWRSDYITQIAAAWVLTAVFARFLEDNRLVDPPRLAGPGDERLTRARDEHELYFRAHPTQTDRDYLLHIFGELRKLPGGKEIFGEHNPIHELPNWLSGDAAAELLKFFQRIDANTGALVHDFTDPNWDTRFLGDLYQDLSETARKKYALLQTPVFVEEFILDRTLDPAIEEFGLEGFRMIDPASGSGHFLLGAFSRILDRWQKKEPGTSVRELVRRSLTSIYGVDVNPYAVAIARFRLLLAALRDCAITRLADSPAFQFNLACGDSLYHGVERQQHLDDWTEESHYFRTEDAENLRRILRSGSYHTVVANPPYIVPKDKAANNAYRRLYTSCYKQYSLAVPFMERIFKLAVRAESPGQTAGYIGQITANSFMKREFGKKLIEEFFRLIDLTHVIDTKGAFIPGHATPTVILFGRNRLPVGKSLRVVRGIRGEPSTPTNPAHGKVWSAILLQVDQPGSESHFISVDEADRQLFLKHPWSTEGGGAADLKKYIDNSSSTTLNDLIQPPIGRAVRIGEEFVFTYSEASWRRRNWPHELRRYFVKGEEVRDWNLAPREWVYYPYADSISNRILIHRFLWPLRSSLENRMTFAGNLKKCGIPWYYYQQHTPSAYSSKLSIVFANIASHNHFVLDRGGSVFDCTAPVIKLRPSATEEEHLALLGLLNSSTSGFWLKQVSQQKQMTGGEGVRIESNAKVPYAYSGTQLGKLPIPEAFKNGPLRQRLIELAGQLDKLGRHLLELTAKRAIERKTAQGQTIRKTWKEYEVERRRVRSKMLIAQEEIDFTVYAMYGLADVELLSDLDLSDVDIDAGERPFEILSGYNEDGFCVTKELPDLWPSKLRHLWQRRIDAIALSRHLRLIEAPFSKRRWIGRQGKYNLKREYDGLGAACMEWLLDRLESYFDFDGRMNKEGRASSRLDIGLISLARLSDIAAADHDFVELGSIYRDDTAFDVQSLVFELVDAESVPLLPVLRYSASGLSKRAEWEKTWELQRQEDGIDIWTEVPKEDPNWLSVTEAKERKNQEIGNVPVPPKYTSEDFQNSSYWRLRGKLDLPKERWVSLPYCEGENGHMVMAWAGYDYLQLARAISAYYVDIQERLGGRDDPRLEPLLASLIELLPWLKQWHNAIDPEFNVPMGDYFEGFIQEEARQMGKTVEEIKNWKPPKKQPTKKRNQQQEDPESRLEV